MALKMSFVTWKAFIEPYNVEMNIFLYILNINKFSNNFQKYKRYFGTYNCAIFATIKKSSLKSL